MGIALNILTGVVSLVGYAPLVIFIGGLAKLTDVSSDLNWADYTKQVAYMLEWYLIAAGAVYYLLVAILAFSGLLKRCHSFLNAWLMCHAALLIYSATKFLVVIEAVDSASAAASEDALYPTTSLKYLRAICAGEIATACWNFFITILIGLCASTVDAPKAAAANTA